MQIKLFTKSDAGNPHKRLACCLVAAGLAGVAQAGKTFTFATGETTGYWDDAARWSSNAYDDRHCYQHGTIYITNSVSGWQFQMHTTRTDGGLNLIMTGKGSWSPAGGLYAGYDKNTLSYVQLDAGATFTPGTSVIGNLGYGVITNYSQNFKCGGPLTFGAKAGAYGELVIVEGAALSQKNPGYNLVIGNSGTGVVVSLNQDYKTSWCNDSTTGKAKIVIGQSATGRGSMIIEDGAWFRGKWIDLGGGAADAGGYGELVLRGGTYGNYFDNGDKTICFTLGTAFTNQSETTYGVIRGWGAFDGDDGNGPNGPYSANRRWSRSVYAQMGRGEIIGDGEGDESHVLDLSKGFCLMTNVLFGVTTTSGWRARNKGAVAIMPASAANWGATSGTKNVGCDPDLETPDLVNAVRISCSGMPGASNKYFGMRLLAPDRTDAHTNALPSGCTVLSVHQLGVFDNQDPGTRAPLSFSGASVKIRYDQTKLSGKSTTRLELWRYKESDDTWTLLTKLQKGKRPADLCISGSFTGVATTGSTGDTYNLGTFAVVERESRGMIVVVW